MIKKEIAYTNQERNINGTKKTNHVLSGGNLAYLQNYGGVC